MPPTRESSSAHRFETVRKVRRYEQVADQIRRLISDGTLKPGDLLPPERELAVRLGVGRSSVRDAVRTLERSEEHTSELQSLAYLVCRLLLEKKKRSLIEKKQINCARRCERPDRLCDCHVRVR